jgi:hypothetical protein
MHLEQGQRDVVENLFAPDHPADALRYAAAWRRVEMGK